MSAPRPRPLLPATLVPLLLAAGLTLACKPRYIPAEVDTPAQPCEPCPTCPEPEPLPPVHSPMVHGGYSAVMGKVSGNLHGEKYFNFLGAVVQIRVRYLEEPKGDIQESTYITCEAEVEVPVRWTEGGFIVDQTITVTAERGDFTRREVQGKTKGAREADHNKYIKTCWLTVLAGEYQISGLSEVTVRGRPKFFELLEPDGQRRALEAASPPSESDFLQIVDDYFWAQP